jgi:hypothetical protein
MRFKILGLATVLAATLSAAPAMACYDGGCGAYTLDGIDYNSRVYLGGCGYGCGITYRERLPDLDGGPQYYFVNQGPTYTGPGNVAPAPSYQERSVSGWAAYSRPYYYGYNGGPYANATNHYYDGAHLQGPAITSYRWNRGRYYRTHYRTPKARPHYYYTEHRTERRSSYVRNSMGAMQKID